MQAHQIALSIAGMIVGGYVGAQIGLRVGVARLEERYKALEQRVDHAERHDIAVIKSQLADARAEIEKLRVIRHDVPGIKSQLGLLISLLSKYIRLDRQV